MALADVQTLLATVTGAEPQSLTPDTRLYEELGIDSLRLVWILNALATRTGTSIPLADALRVRTVADLVTSLASAKAMATGETSTQQ